jgi:hypothetical protein
MYIHNTQMPKKCTIIKIINSKINSKIHQYYDDAVKYNYNKAVGSHDTMLVPLHSHIKYAFG